VTELHSEELALWKKQLVFYAVAFLKKMLLNSNAVS